MAKKPEIVELNLDQDLFDSEKRPTSMSLPLAIHHRLDHLAELANRTGASRAEIIGMLVSEAPLDAAEIRRRIMDYRDRTVGDVVPDDPSQHAVEDGERGNIVRFEKRSPGRPRREAG